MSVYRTIGPLVFIPYMDYNFQIFELKTVISNPTDVQKSSTKNNTVHNEPHHEKTGFLHM